MTWTADDHAAELPLYRDMVESAEAIVDWVCGLGMAGQWHARRAAAMMADPKRIPAHSIRGEIGELVPPKPDDLPELTRAIREQDGRCRTAWARIRPDADHPDYRAEQLRLRSLFDRLALDWRPYERLVRRPERPLLTVARRLLAAGGGHASPEAVTLEDNIRLPLAAFVAGEERVDRLLARLDDIRGRLVASHAGWAIGLANLDAVATDRRERVQAGALHGLERSTCCYDHRRGYRFRTYAQWWVKEFARRAGGEEPNERRPDASPRQ